MRKVLNIVIALSLFGTVVSGFSSTISCDALKGNWAGNVGCTADTWPGSPWYNDCHVALNLWPDSGGSGGYQDSFNLSIPEGGGESESGYVAGCQTTADGYPFVHFSRTPVGYQVFLKLDGNVAWIVDDGGSQNNNRFSGMIYRVGIKHKYKSSDITYLSNSLILRTMVSINNQLFYQLGHLSAKDKSIAWEQAQYLWDGPDTTKSSQVSGTFASAAVDPKTGTIIVTEVTPGNQLNYQTGKLRSDGGAVIWNPVEPISDPGSPMDPVSAINSSVSILPDGTIFVAEVNTSIQLNYQTGKINSHYWTVKWNPIEPISDPGSPIDPVLAINSSVSLLSDGTIFVAEVNTSNQLNYQTGKINSHYWTVKWNPIEPISDPGSPIDPVLAINSSVTVIPNGTSNGTIVVTEVEPSSQISYQTGELHGDGYVGWNPVEPVSDDGSLNPVPGIYSSLVSFSDGTMLMGQLGPAKYRVGRLNSNREFVTWTPIS